MVNCVLQQIACILWFSLTFLSLDTLRCFEAHMLRFARWWIVPTGNPRTIVIPPITFQEKGEDSEEEEATFIMGVGTRGSIVEVAGGVVGTWATMIKILVPMMVDMELSPLALVEWSHIHHHHQPGLHHSNVSTGFTLPES